MEDLQSLLEKINRDGVEKADAKAAEILSAAKAKADDLVKSARTEAAKAKAEAEQAAADYAQRSEVTIRQAARDLVLEIQSSITALFERALAQGVDRALGDDQTVSELAAAALRELAEGGEIVLG